MWKRPHIRDVNDNTYIEKVFLLVDPRNYLNLILNTAPCWLIGDPTTKCESDPMISAIAELAN